MATEKDLDVVGDMDDYESLPKWELQQRVLNNDERARRVYLARYGNG